MARAVGWRGADCNCRGVFARVAPATPRDSGYTGQNQQPPNPPEVMRLLAQVVDEDYLHRPDVFRRDALELTFQLLRQDHPHLALLIQNLIQGMPLMENGESQARQALHVRMSRLQVTAICLALSHQGETVASPSGNAAPDFARQWIVIWALIRDWQALEASDCCD